MKSTERSSPSKRHGSHLGVYVVRRRRDSIVCTMDLRKLASSTLHVDRCVPSDVSIALSLEVVLAGSALLDLSLERASLGRYTVLLEPIETQHPPGTAKPPLFLPLGRPRRRGGLDSPAPTSEPLAALTIAPRRSSSATSYESPSALRILSFLVYVSSRRRLPPLSCHCDNDTPDDSSPFLRLVTSRDFWERRAVWSSQCDMTLFSSRTPGPSPSSSLQSALSPRALVCHAHDENVAPLWVEEPRCLLPSCPAY
ncbi:hypothetical protein R3P38DRAFT_414893 [Favolaschia claudopus]|uniref:Uncharacterized protein n=1 Tax=Favolaschia claudopus TaxID=2862362 RepID=A0AAV9ZHD5_9AGAR